MPNTAPRFHCRTATGFLKQALLASIIAIVITALFFRPGLSLAGANHVWEGNANTSWSNAANWGGDGKPTADGSSVVFNNNTRDDLNINEAPPASLQFIGEGSGKTVEITGNAVTVSGDPAIMCGSNQIDFSVPVTLTTTSSFSGCTGAGLNFNDTVDNNGHTLVTEGGYVVFHDVLTGSGGLIVNGGTTTFYSPANYTGGATVNGGELHADGSDLLPLNSDLTLNAGGAFRLWNDRTQTIDKLSGAGEVRIRAGGVLTIGGAGGSSTFSGAITQGGSMVKAGAGTLTLSGDSTHTGTTTVNAGILKVDGSLSNTATTVNNGGALQGTGSIAGTVTIQNGGALAPGGSIGQFATGNLTLNNGGSLDIEINGTASDRVNVTGSVELNTPTLNVTAGGSPSYGDEFIIISNDGIDAVNGQFNGLAEGDSLTSGGIAFEITYQGGDGNDVVLTVVWPIDTPTATAATSVTIDEFTANWTASAGVTTYYLDVALDSGFTNYFPDHMDLPVGPVTSRVVSMLSPGTTYYYRVRAGNNYGTTANSNVISVTTIPPAPVASAATGIGSSGLTANWNAASGASAYYLDVATDNGFTNFAPGYQNKNVGNVTSSTVSGLSANTAYYYRVRAGNASGTGANSGVISTGTAPAAPQALSPTGISTNCFTAQWAASAGAVNYYLDVSANSGFTNYVTGCQNKNVGNATSRAVSGLAPGITYYYRVRCSNARGVSENSNTASLTTIPPAPKVSDATGIGNSGFTANWQAAPGAKGYYLDVSANPTFTDYNWGGFSNRKLGNVTSYSVSGLRKEWTYAFRVRAYNDAGVSTNSNSKSATTTGGESQKPNPPTIPGGQGSSPSPGSYSGKVGLSWGASTSVSESGMKISADFYRIYRAESPLGEKTLLGETASTAFDDLTAEPGRRYYYWVTAVNSSGESDFGDYMVAWRYDKNPGRCGLFSNTGNAGLMWWGCASNQMCLWYLDGVDRSGVSPAGTTDAANEYLIKAIADFDGDGVSDLFWFNPNDGKSEIWLLKATSPDSAGAGLNWLIKEKKAMEAAAHGRQLIKAGDFNGDKKADILWRDLTNGQLSIWLLNENTVLAKASPAWGEGVQCANEGEMDFNPSSSMDLPQPTSSLGWEVQGLADFTADGRSEILWRNPSTGTLVTWIMEDAIIAGCGYNSTRNWQGWEIQDLADLDGDQRADILWRNRQDGGLRTWLMDGSAVKERLALSLAEPARSWMIKDLGDFNADGRADIYWRDQNAGTVRIWLMDGADVLQTGAPGQIHDFD